MNSASIAIATQWHYYSSQKATDQLGYRSRPLRESVEDAWQWLCEYGYAGSDGSVRSD